MNKDSLKKNHFWILAGLVPLLVLIAVLVISSSVGSAIEAKKKVIDETKKDLAAKSSPKPTKLIEKVVAQNEELGVKRGKLWDVNWERQKSEFKWPNHPLLKQIEAGDYKFGAKLPSSEGEYEQFRQPVYLAEYSNPTGRVPGMVERVAPTQFKGSWKQVLRHVNNWGDRTIQSDQIWLAMEDIWVQRALLSAVKSVNDHVATFVRVPLDPNNTSAPDNKLRRRFVSPTWEVELWTEKQADGKTILKGKLTNLTDRLQLLGLGNEMTLNVWLEDTTKNPRAAPFPFRVGAESLPGKGAKKVVKDDKGVAKEIPANVLEVVTTRKHEIDTGMPVNEIFRVEQAFDARTVPVRRIDRVVLGQLDARNAAATLKKTDEMAKKDEAAAAATGAATGGTTEGGPPPGMIMLRPGPGGGPPGAEGGLGGTAAGGGMREGGGPADLVLDGNRARYLEVSPNVRRMPVGIVLVVDQAYLQDVLIAYANSPLRFQITQVHWQRFRGELAGVGSGSGGSTGGETEGGGVVMSSGSGVFGRGLGGSESEGGISMRPPGGGPPGVPPGGPPGMMMPGGIGMMPGSGSGTLTTVSEAQLTAGLVEVSIYGIISLYEKFETKPAEGTPPAETKEPEKKEPKEADPKAVDLKATDPKGTDPKGTDPKEKGKNAPTEALPKGTDPKTGTETKTGTEPKGKN